MYSLIGSLVIMCDCEAGTLTGVFAHASQFKYGQFRHQTGLCLGTKWACAQFKNGSHVFWSRVCSSHVLHPLSATRSQILNVSRCKVVCRRHDDPTNGPIGDPGMVHLP